MHSSKFYSCCRALKPTWRSTVHLPYHMRICLPQVVEALAEAALRLQLATCEELARILLVASRAVEATLPLVSLKAAPGQEKLAWLGQSD